MDFITHSRILDAEYRDEKIKAFKGNPYIEGLPDLPTDEDLAEMMKCEPEFSTSERKLSKSYRIQKLDSLLDMVVPLPRAVALARSVFKLVRTGYSKRKPFTKADFDIRRDLYLAAQRGCFRTPPRRRGCIQHSLGLSGASGSGKSFILKRIVEMWPEALTHRHMSKLQVPFLFIEMSPDGISVHAIADQMFLEMDRLVEGEDFAHMYRTGYASQRLVASFNVAYRLGVGAIIIDEKQNQHSIGKDPARRTRRDGDKRPKEETSLSKHLVMASNISNIPLVMAGTLETLHMLGARLTGGRRLSGRGSAAWLPLEATFNLNIPDEFELLMQALWKYQWTEDSVRIGRGWLSQFYRLSQGVPDVMVKLFIAAQERAILSDQSTITKEIVEDAYRLEFVHADFALDGMRRRDKARLPVLTDLYHPGLSPAEAPELPPEDHGTRKPAALQVRTTGVASQTEVKAPIERVGVRRPDGKLQMGSAQPKPHFLPASVLKGVDLRDAIELGQNPVGLGEED